MVGLRYSREKIFNYERSNLPIAIGIGNVLEVVTDRKLAVSDDGIAVDYYIADVVSQSDYFPFGMVMANTSDDPEDHDYRYGFNGYEADNEVKGDGNSYTSYYREYDPRISCWLSTDPMQVKFPGQSPYVAYDGNPILLSDLLGGETEDNIGIDRAGNISFSEKTDDEFDRLYSTDEKGNIANEKTFVQVNDKSILPQLYESKGDIRLIAIDGRDEGKVGEKHIATSENYEDVANLFVFLAEKTNFEWAVYFTTDNKLIIGTLMMDNKAPGLKSIAHDELDFKSMIHSHPTPQSEKDAIPGLDGDKQLSSK